MSVYPKEQRPVNVLEFAVFTNRLSNGQDVPFVERHVESRSSMAGRTEDNPLSGIARIRP
jgi:hypothetical protein